MAEKIGDRHDIGMRLNETLCRYDGDAVCVYTNAYLDDDTIDVTFLKDGSIKKGIKISDKKFDYSSPKVGYIQSNKNCGFMTRAPIRSQKQGLSKGNIYYNNGRISNQMFLSGSMHNMIVGEYPTYLRAIKKIIKGGYNGVAISRSFAIFLGKGCLELEYRGKRIAMCYDYKDRTVPTFIVNESPMASFYNRIMEKSGLFKGDKT